MKEIFLGFIMAGVILCGAYATNRFITPRLVGATTVKPMVLETSTEPTIALDGKSNDEIGFCEERQILLIIDCDGNISGTNSRFIGILVEEETDKGFSWYNYKRET